MTSRALTFFALLAVLSPRSVFAADDALRGKMAMSAYVSVYGDKEINGTMRGRVQLDLPIKLDFDQDRLYLFDAATEQAL